jgi:hypothetical protein
MRTLLAVLVLAGLTTGCVTTEGIKLPTSGPTKESVEDFNKRNATAQTPAPAEELPLRPTRGRARHARPRGDS